MLGNTANKLSTFRTKNLVEINDEARGIYNVISQIKFKTTTLKFSLCNYSDVYILMKGTITISGEPYSATGENKQLDERKKEVAFKTSAAFTDCISQINNT